MLLLLLLLLFGFGALKGLVIDPSPDLSALMLGFDGMVATGSLLLLLLFLLLLFKFLNSKSMALGSEPLLSTWFTIGSDPGTDDDDDDDEEEAYGFTMCFTGTTIELSGIFPSPEVRSLSLYSNGLVWILLFLNPGPIDAWITSDSSMDDDGDGTNEEESIVLMVNDRDFGEYMPYIAIENMLTIIKVTIFQNANRLFF